MMHSKKSNKTPPHSWSFDALGTSWSIETAKELSNDMRELISQRIELYDKTYSRFREDSLARQLRIPGTYEFPSDSSELFDTYQKLYDITHGRMTPLIGSMLEDVGYDEKYSLQPKSAVRSIPSFEALGWDGNTTVTIAEPIVLDVGAAGKGHLVDIIAKILESFDVDTYTIDASGDIKQRGEPQVIGLEHPLDSSKIVGTATLQNQSLCASAINRRAWQGMHHVFDPLTKQPTKSMLATWAIADTTLVADALATALFFTPANELLEHYDFTYVTIDVNGAIDVSPGFKGELYT